MENALAANIQTMKIIHTSDWHLGQYFYSRSRAAEHQAFLNWLLDEITTHDVDVLLVSGDIFDTGSPPSYARELYNQFVVNLQQTRCQMKILAGNHDSVATLNESRQLLACLSTQVFATVATPAEQVQVLQDKNGNNSAILCAIPYLRPRDIQQSLAGQTGREKQHDFIQAITQYYHQSYLAAETIRQQLAPLPLPIIMTGHLTTVGASLSDSVRDIYIGTLSAFPAQLFPKADYIALGHIHRAQRVGGSDHIRYSGSPIPLSFDESRQQKSVYLIDFKQKTTPEITTLPIPCFQPMFTLQGDFQALSQQLANLPPPQEGKRIWLDLEVNEPQSLDNLQQQIETLINDRPLDVLLLRRKSCGQLGGLHAVKQERLSELSIEDVFQRRLLLAELSDETNQKLTALFKLSVAKLQEKDSE